MRRRYGRVLRGQRIQEALPGGHCKAVTVLVAMTISSATDGEVFLSFIRDVLGPTLRKGQVVVMDNLAAQKVDGESEAIAELGASVL
jgi:hypothetical protein